MTSRHSTSILRKPYGLRSRSKTPSRSSSPSTTRTSSVPRSSSNYRSSRDDPSGSTSHRPPQPPPSSSSTSNNTNNNGTSKSKFRSRILSGALRSEKPPKIKTITSSSRTSSTTRGSPTNDKYRRTNNNHAGNSSSNPNTTAEVDVSKNPTKLLRLIMYKQYQAAIARLDYHPKEASTWVCLHDQGAPPPPSSSSTSSSNSAYTARHLPIHIACLLIKPQQPSVEPLIKRLMEVYPDGVKGTDNGGKLPLHIACWKGASLYIVALMLKIYPGSIHILDKSRKSPLDYTKSSQAPNRHEVMKALVKVKNGQLQREKEEQAKASSSPKEEKGLPPIRERTEERLSKTTTASAVPSSSRQLTERHDRPERDTTTTIPAALPPPPRLTRDNSLTSINDDSRNMLSSSASSIAANADDVEYPANNTHQPNAYHHNLSSADAAALAARNRANVMFAIEAFRTRLSHSEKRLSETASTTSSQRSLLQQHQNDRLLSKNEELDAKLKSMNDKYFATKVENTILKKKQAKLMQDAVTYEQECRSLRQTIKSLKRHYRAGAGGPSSRGSVRGSDYSDTESLGSRDSGVSGSRNEDGGSYGRLQATSSRRRRSMDHLSEGGERRAIVPVGTKEEHEEMDVRSVRSYNSDGRSVITMDTALVPYREELAKEEGDATSSSSSMVVDNKSKRKKASMRNIDAIMETAAVTTNDNNHDDDELMIVKADEKKMETNELVKIDDTTPDETNNHVKEENHPLDEPSDVDVANTEPPAKEPFPDTTFPETTTPHDEQFDSTEDYQVSEEDKDYTIANLESQNAALHRLIASQSLLLKDIQEGTVSAVRHWRYGILQNINTEVVDELRKLLQGECHIDAPVQSFITSARYEEGLEEMTKEDFEDYWGTS